MRINALAPKVLNRYQNKRNLKNASSDFSIKPDNDSFKKGLNLTNAQKINFGFILEVLVYETIMLGGMLLVGSLVGEDNSKSHYNYSSNIDKTSKETEKDKIKSTREEQIKKFMKSLNISREQAEKYHDSFLSIAMIKPTGDGNEKGINAIMGYGVEKYNLAMQFLTPIITAQKTGKDEAKKLVPNGLVLYGPGGSGKTYMVNHLSEHLQEFGVDVKEIVFDEDKHTENAIKIKKVFEEAQENFDKTGKYTIIKFPQDIDDFLKDRAKDDEFSKELRTFLLQADNCASKGAIWIATANNPKKIDGSVLRRATIKMPIGVMKDFQIGDMIKYSLMKYGKKDKADSFDYQKVVDYVREINKDYTPEEYEDFTLCAINSGDISAEGIIEQIDILGEELTLNETAKVKFQQDIEYVNDLDKKQAREK